MLPRDAADISAPYSCPGCGKEVNSANSLSKTEVETLLKKGAYGALMDDETAGDKFCEEDIEVKESLA